MVGDSSENHDLIRLHFLFNYDYDEVFNIYTIYIYTLSERKCQRDNGWVGQAKLFHK